LIQAPSADQSCTFPSLPAMAIHFPFGAMLIAVTATSP
jgi:hypothetical protein